MSVKPPLPAKRGFALGSAPTVCREQAPGLEITVLKRLRLREVYLTLRPLPGESARAMFNRLGHTLQQHQATIVKQEVFGALSARAAAMRSLQQALGSIAWPVTWLDGADCSGGKIAGTHVLAVQGVPVEPVFRERQLIGTLYHDGAARHCFLGNVSPRNRSRSRPEQARRAYAEMDAALQSAGMDATNVVRTWFFLDDILGWYGHFNKVRADYFRRHKIYDELVPVSTGVGARNPTAAALAVSAWAMQPLNDTITIEEVPSPLQCPAPSYGSSFSRAAEITTPDYRQLLISGTASIEPGGCSVHEGDIVAQVDLTLRVVEEILRLRKMSFLDVSRATAYFKHTKDAAVFKDWCKLRGLGALPVICTRSDVCRDELWFELEMDAVVPASRRE